MSFPFELFTSTASVAAGLISVASTLYAYFRNKKNEKDKMAKAQEINFEAVLDSDDINVLGTYLDETLGRFNIHEYTESIKVGERVDKYLDKIQSFVGTTENIPKEVGPKEVESAEEPVEGFSEEFQMILDELKTGEPWNALARLRRHIEMRLRDIASRQGYKARHLKSAGQILRLLYDRKYVDPDSYELLMYSISVCNRAIHGMDISEDEAEQAVFLGSKALQRFNNLRG